MMLNDFTPEENLERLENSIKGALQEAKRRDTRVKEIEARIQQGTDDRVASIVNSIAKYGHAVSEFILFAVIEETFYPLAYWETIGNSGSDAIIPLIKGAQTTIKSSEGKYILLHLVDGDFVGVAAVDSFKAIHFASLLPKASWMISFRDFVSKD